MRRRRGLALALAFVSLFGEGCATHREIKPIRSVDCKPPTLEPTNGESQLRISQPVYEVCCPPEVDVGLSPLSIDLSQLKPEDFQSLTLQDAIQIALANSRVMRDVGAPYIAHDA